MQTTSWCSTAAGWWSRGRTPSCWPRAASTPASGTASARRRRRARCWPRRWPRKASASRTGGSDSGPPAPACAQKQRRRVTRPASDCHLQPEAPSRPLQNRIVRWSRILTAVEGGSVTLATELGDCPGPAARLRHDRAETTNDAATVAGVAAAPRVEGGTSAHRQGSGDPGRPAVRGRQGGGHRPHRPALHGDAAGTHADRLVRVGARYGHAVEGSPDGACAGLVGLAVGARVEREGETRRRGRSPALAADAGGTE